MSASEEDSKIDMLDTPADVKRKLKRAFCEPGKIEDNGVLGFAKHVLFPIFNKIEVSRKPEFGGVKEYTSYEDLENDFVKLVSCRAECVHVKFIMFSSQELHPGDLKASIEKYLNQLLDPIRETFQDIELQKLTKNAYPPLVKSKLILI